MIEARAVVTRAEAGEAWVRLSDRAGGCGRCDEPGGCGGASLAHALKAPRQLFRLPNGIEAEPGDRVRIRIEDGGPLRGAVLAYGLGVAMLVGGAAVGTWAAPPGQVDLLAALGAGGGLVASLLLNRLVLRSRRWSSRFAVEMVRESDACPHPAGRPS